MGYQTVTLLDLLTQLSQRYEGTPFWTQSNAVATINEGIRIYNLITGMYRAPTTVPLIPDDSHVFVTGVMLKGTRVITSADPLPLTLTSINALDRAVPNWQGVNCASGGNTPIVPRFWTPVGLTEIQIYPKIAPAQLGMTVTVDGVLSTPILVNPGDYLNMGREDVSSLLGYALHVLSFSKGIDTLRKTQPGFAEFIKACGLRNAEFVASGLYRQLVGTDRTRDSQPMVDPGALAQAQALLASVAGGGSGSSGSGDQGGS